MIIKINQLWGVQLNIRVKNIRGPLIHYVILNMEEIFLHKSLSELKGLCKKLELKRIGKSKDLISKDLVAFLNTEKGRKKAEGIIPKDILDTYDNLILQQVSTAPTGSLLKCICTSEKGASIPCSKCNCYQHLNCIGKNNKLLTYVCTQCILEKINPLDYPIELLIPPFRSKEVTAANILNNTVPEKYFEYKIDRKDMIEQGRGLYQIQVRSIRLDGVSFCMSWPSKGLLIVNEKIAMRFETSNNPNAKKRRDEPLNITTILHPGKNTICIHQYNDPNIYCVALYLIYRKSEERLIEEIKCCNIVTTEKSKEFISKILRSGDEEIKSDSIKFSLKCPITMTLMELPVRGINCNHVQCFNLGPYIQLQRYSKVNR